MKIREREDSLAYFDCQLGVKLNLGKKTQLPSLSIVPLIFGWSTQDEEANFNLDYA
jgi:hypothetical protein